MKKHILFAFLFTILGTFAFAQKSEEKLVRECFEKYRTDLLNDDGVAAAEDVSIKTLQYYTDLLELTKTADSSNIETLSVMDKMMVLILRLKVSKEEILSLDGKGLFVYAVNKGMVGKGSVANNTVGEIKINKDFAAAQFIAKGAKTEMYFEFYKEAGSWKLDVTSLFPMAIMVFDKMIADSGKSENEFLLPLIEASTGKKVTTETWLPLK